MDELERQITIEELIEEFKKYNNNEKDIKLINKAYDYAYQKHFGVKRITGDDYIIHPLNVAMILTDINADAECLAAALLHDTVEDTDSTKEEITSLFGESVANLVDGVTKINKLHFSNTTEQMAANQRKILVGLSTDVRVLIIKLADRLHNLRTLYVMPEEKQKKKARETLEILTPVADRLGINKIKNELEDLSLRYYKPDVYFDIVEKLNAKKTELDDSVNDMLREVSSLLNEHNIKHEIFGRSKSIYSIYKKLNKGKRFNDIYDILALRVLLDTEQECYLALGLIHSKYKPVPNRFKDYVAMPKTNLYQSLHTTVFGVEGKLFEIQIRTHDMHKIAEYGIASHWSYKLHGSVKSVKDSMEDKLQIFRNIIELNEDTDTPEEFISSIKQDILTSESIYVYTPKGDVLELPSGSTPVDFAYKVHSEVGNTLVGALVNDSIVPLDYKLKTGDIIKVNTNKTSKGPNKDWLNFVVTSQAKNKIKSFYSKINKNEILLRGQELFQNELRKNDLPINETINSVELSKAIEELNLKSINELYMSLGNNQITALSVIKLMFKKEVVEDLTTKINETTNKQVQSKNDILVQGLEDIKVNLSGCCKPIPGDKVVGYITKGSGITVHRTICQNVSNLEERLLPVKWNRALSKKYFTDIIIHTNTSDNLIDIITKASLNNITIDSIKTINKSEYKVYILTILVENTEILNKFIIDLTNLPFTIKVDRLLK